jgi:hypothetical protein
MSCYRTVNWVRNRLKSVTFPGAIMTASNDVSVPVVAAAAAESTTASSEGMTSSNATSASVPVVVAAADPTTAPVAGMTSSNDVVAAAVPVTENGNVTFNGARVTLSTDSDTRTREVEASINFLSSQQSTMSNTSLRYQKELELYNKYQFKSPQHFFAAMNFATTGGVTDEKKIIRYIRKHGTHTYRNEFE